ncbi:MAG: glycosyltransferase family 2 protein, partial [Chitinophagaceae bacterium]
MKDLSVIIVNFNVKELLNQCLMSLKTALEGIKAEIIVVDNASTDGSQAFFDNYQSKDPFYGGIRFVFLNENLGFSKANNIGIGMSEGALVLLLNPDTIVTAGALQKCIEQFQKNPQAGAVGVRMVDGDGVFLKESKRGYPSLKTTLFKSIGLSELFPRSSIFGKYHLGNINEYATAQVEILCGAFMMIRGQLLKKIEGFDERFFMYGEDIDL